MKRLLGILVLLVVFAGSVKAQNDRDLQAEVRLKSIYLYNFATLVDWPKEYKKGNFVIGVLGESMLYDELVAKYSSKMIGSQPIRIKKFSSASQVTGCHILFVTEGKSDNVPSLSRKHKSTLIVSEGEDLLSKGAIISFIVKGSKTKYELSKTNAEKNNLIIGSTLSNLAASVE